MSGGPSYSEENGILKIKIKPVIKFIVRIIYVGQFLFLTGAMLVASWLIYEDDSDFSMLALLTLLSIFIIFFVFRKGLGRIFYIDRIELSETELRINRRKLFISKSISIPLTDIKYIYFNNRDSDNTNLNKNDSHDVTGFHFAQSEVDFFIAMGKLVIETKTGSHFIGEDIPSWDGEELAQRIDAFAGHRFPVRMLN